MSVTLTLNLSKLHSGQEEVVEHPARFKVVICGRRWGKSFLGQDVIAETVVTNDKPCAYLTPTYKMLAETWRSLTDTLAPIIVKRNVQEKRLEFITGATLDFWSLDTTAAERLRGRAYSKMILDEAALVKDGMDVWNRVLRPTLTDYEGGAYFLTTPRGKLNYIYDLYKLGQNPDYPDWMSWRKPTRDNPFIKESEIESARGTMTIEDFGQEYLADFTTLSGAIFPNWHDDNVTVDAEYDNRYPIIWGVDWGYTNPTCILFAQQRPFRGMPDHLCVFDEIYISGQLERVVLEKALNHSLERGYQMPETFIYDTESPSGAAEMSILRNTFYGGFMCSLIGADKRPGSVSESIKVVRRFIGEDGNGRRLLRVHPRCEHLIEEIPNYVYADNTVRTRGGDLMPASGQTDHAVDCCRYLLTPYLFKGTE